MNDSNSLTLNEIVLLAAFKLIEDDLEKSFTAEDLVVASWKEDHSAFGLRGYETKYPDSNKLYTKIDGRDGLVAKGYFDKIGDRLYKLSIRGKSKAASLKPVEATIEAKLNRQLQDKISNILNNPDFQKWLKDPSHPKKFRGAGNFWGIAPGTPSKSVSKRLTAIENTLQTALEKIEELGLDSISEQRGKTLFERNDVKRCLDFHETLKKRFSKELSVLDPNGDY